MNLEPARLPGESQAQYLDRRKYNNSSLKHHLRYGHLLWTSCRLVDGREMISHIRQTNKYPTQAEREALDKKYPKDVLFKLDVQGTYNRAVSGRIGTEPVYGRKRILPSNRPKAIAARAQH
jgi:hypothetical protein